MATKNQVLLSRRGLLKGLGAGAGALALGSLVRPQIARAQGGDAAAQIAGFYRFNVGDIAVTMIQDGSGQFPFPPEFMGVNAAEGEVAALNEANNIPADRVFGGFNIALLQIGDRRVLLDTGNGPAAFEAGNGRLLPTIEALGLTAEDITDVIFSHYHPDHINGAFTEEGLLFPNAVHYFPQPEYDFLQNATNVPEQIQGIVDAANVFVELVESTEQLELFDFDAEIIPGVSSIAAPGHSPGHAALLVSSGDSQLLGTFDAAISLPINVQRPDFYFGFDADPAQAVETRVALLGRAADEGIRTFGYHFPFPGVGYVVREGEGFRFVPAI